MRSVLLVRWRDGAIGEPVGQLLDQLGAQPGDLLEPAFEGSQSAEDLAQPLLLLVLQYGNLHPAYIEAVHGFLDCVTAAFPDLADVADGTLTPADLRSRSLLGSVGMLRVLAGSYRALAEKGMAEDDISAFFATLAPHLAAPVSDDGIWRRTEAGRDFEPNVSAPVMCTQNLQHLVATVTSWYPNAPQP